MYPDQSNLTCLISFGVLSFLVASSTIFSKACNSSITISGILDPYSVRALLLFAILCTTLFSVFYKRLQFMYMKINVPLLRICRMHCNNNVEYLFSFFGATTTRSKHQLLHRYFYLSWSSKTQLLRFVLTYF